MGLSHQTQTESISFTQQFLGSVCEASVLAILRTARCNDHNKIDNKQQAIVQNLVIGPIIQNQFLFNSKLFVDVFNLNIVSSIAIEAAHGSNSNNINKWFIVLWLLYCKLHTENPNMQELI